MTQELRLLIEDLKEINTLQSNELREIKANQQVLKSQNAELQEQVQGLQEQLEAIPTTGHTAKTWAEVATTASQQLPATPPKRNPREPNCVRISTRKIPNNDEGENSGFGRYLPIDMAKAKIRSALLSADTTKDVQVAGIGTTKTGYII
jgi:FtsZ-binding cell division protein ZapB